MKIFFNLNYSGETAENMINSCLRKFYKGFKQEINVKFDTHYRKTTKMSFFANTKDKTSSLYQSSVVCKFTWPGCSCNYTSKTDQTLQERTEEHAYPNKKSNKQSATYEYLSTCPHDSHILALFNVNNHDVNCNKLNINQNRSSTM